jgi:hypothetical protein
MVENELIVDDEELVGELIGFIVDFEDIKADVGL